MTDFLLELRSEEIPARMQRGAREELDKLFRAQMAAAGVSPGAITVWSTPRRLVLIARDLPDTTAAVSEEFKGPRTSAPEQALEGFLRKTGLTRDQLQDRDGVWFAVIDKPGRAVKDVLAEAIPSIIRQFSWPKSQRWGAASLSTECLRWVRPLSGIVAILGEELVECAVDGIASGYATHGHRFHCPGEITIGSAADYQEKLRACHVIVDHEERQDTIRREAAAVAAAAGLTLVADEGLVVENAGLTEWPVPLLGRFDEAFLDVPPEVIQLTARVNQKYFVCTGADGKLANAFVCTANITADDPAVVVDGNRKVLAARLSDARFFWEQDQKVSLEDHARKLARITFHEKLGTVADKVERVAKLARWLAEEGIVPGANPDLAEQAARLCKADLVTEMVGEFPELQGLMGGYYARAAGLPDAVADAVRDHYKPVGQGDEVPTAPVTVAVSLADKLDTLRSFFGIEEKPTGSKDPFALRRAALGIIRVIQDNGLRFGVAEGDLLDFFADRLKVQQREAGVRHDIIDAVFALGGEDDLVRLLARVNAVQSYIETAEGANLLAGYKRAANILKKEDWQGIEGQIAQTGEEDPLAMVDDPLVASAVAAKMAMRHAPGLPYDPEPAEAALIAALDEAEPKATAAIAAEDFAGAMAALATLRGPIDAFFESVTVNDADPAKRGQRLALLARFRAAVHNVADFSRIEG
ncbi:glycine--tRNA ligase subunit beta [Alteraurantiacibacter buctensis]|uniref:Glycine--tRNA ligase beta subunit n=1 Tax=Alteraurantiacibacter buctensis TaxID=1503981 RepID=A0A844YXC3_9SPHN|nr:glycine--tRNA ligase subunit beta [Alteraurantiacibacter buctensis]